MTKHRQPYKTYTLEFKLEALRMIEQSDKPSSEIAAELGIRRNQLYKWKEQLTAFPEKRNGLKKGRRVLCQRAQVKYAFIKSHRLRHDLSLLFSTLEVSVSGYYDWLDRLLSKMQSTNKRLLTKIRRFHQANYKRYGSPRTHRDFIDSGEKVKSSTCCSIDEIRRY